MSRIDMEDGDLVADFDGREFSYGFGDLDELVLGYATTLHKREYPAVVMRRLLDVLSERLFTTIYPDLRDFTRAGARRKGKKKAMGEFPTSLIGKTQRCVGRPDATKRVGKQRLTQRRTKP